MKDFLQKNIERLEGLRKEIPDWVDYESAAEDIGYNFFLDKEIEYYKSELKKLE